MEKDLLIKALTDAVNNYIADEECYDDNVQIEIDPATGGVALCDADTGRENCDYYQVMDLVSMSTDNPGQWEVDSEAVNDVASQYSAG